MIFDILSGLLKNCIVGRKFRYQKAREKSEENRTLKSFSNFDNTPEESPTEFHKISTKKFIKTTYSKGKKNLYILKFIVSLIIIF